MRFLVIFLLAMIAFPIFADDTPEIVQVARLGRGTAYTLAWRPDGKVLAVGSATGVWFFDEDFQELGRLADDIPVHNLEWSPDGNRLITFYDDYKQEGCDFLVWIVSNDVEDNSVDIRLDYCPRSVDWSSDGKLIAIGMADLYNTETNVVVLSGDTYEIVTEYPDMGMYVAFSPDGQSLAINHIDALNPLVVLKPRTGEILIEITNLKVSDEISWSFDGNYISAYCDPEGEDTFRNQSGTCVWNVKTQELINSGLLFDFLWHPHKLHFVTEDRAGIGMTPPTNIVRYYDDLSEDFVMDIEDTYYEETISSLTWHPSGRYLLGITASSQFYKFDVVNRKHNVINASFQPFPHTTSWIPDSLSILSVTGGWIRLSHVNEWNLNQDQNVFVPAKSQILDDIDSIQWIDNSQDFIAHSWKEWRYYIASIYDSQTLKESRQLLNYVEQTNMPIVSWSGDSHRVAYVVDGILTIANKMFDNDSNAIQSNIGVNNLLQISWSPDDSMIATAGSVGDIETNYYLIEIWNSYTGERISSFGIDWLEHYDHFIWSPDNKHVLVTSNRTTGGGCVMNVDVYPVVEGEFYNRFSAIPEFHTFDWKTESSTNCRVPEATYSPDGQLIAVAFPEALRIFDTHEEDAVVEIPLVNLNSLDWHEDGQYLAGGASDGTIYVWDVSAVMKD